MMPRRARIVLAYCCCCVCLAIGYITCDEPFSPAPESYIQFPSMAELKNPFHKTVLASLFHLAKRESDSVEISDLLDEAINDETTDVIHRQVYRNLLQVRPSKQYFNVFLSIWAQSRGRWFNRLFKKIHTHMKDAHQQSFSFYADNINYHYSLNKHQPKEATDFERLFRTAFDCKDCKLFALRRKLTHFSFAKLRFPLDTMVRKARSMGKHDPKPADYDEHDDYSVLKNFWLVRCEVFDDDPLNTMLNFVAYAFRTMHPLSPGRYDRSLLLMAEYRRLCYEWKNDHMMWPFSGPIRSNIERMHKLNS